MLLLLHLRERVVKRPGHVHLLEPGSNADPLLDDEIAGPFQD